MNSDNKGHSQDLRQNSVGATGNQGSPSGNQSLPNAYIHGQKGGKIVGMNMQGSQMRNMRNQMKEQSQSVGGQGGGMNPAHHRKSNSGSVNSQAVMSGKHQMGQGGIGNMKFVKPSELSLDLISPTNIRNMGVKGAHGSVHNQTTLAGGSPPALGSNGQNMQNILQNFRTPQNVGGINNGLSMYGANQQKSKELPGIHGASQQRSSDGQDHSTLQNSYQYKKRNASGNHRNIMQMNNQAMGAQYIHGSNHNSITPSKNGGKMIQGGIRGNTDGGVGSGNLGLGPGGQNSKTPKEAYKRINGINGNSSHDRGLSSDDRLNLSVDIAGRHPANSQNQIGQIGYNMNPNQRNKGYKQQTQARDYSLRMSRINEEKLLNNSVHDFSGKGQKNSVGGIDLSLHEMSLHHGGHHNHSKSLMKSDDINLVDKKKEILEKKRYEQMHRNQQSKAQASVDDQQAGEEQQAKLDSSVQLNLENLTKIDDKFSQLVDCLKTQKVNNISQLCSDWWELTDEDDYSIAKFEKAIKEERSKRDFKQMMTLEILSIAVVNYYTSSPDVLKPTHLQIQQVKNLLSYIQQNFLGAVESLLAKLPNELLANNYANQLQKIVQTKRHKKSKSKDPNSMQLSVRQMNEQIINILKGIIRQGQQAGAGANMSAKRLLQMRNQGLLKSSMVTGAALRPLYSVINRTLKNLEQYSIGQVRNNIIKASEEIEKFKQYANLPPLYGVGGTAIGGYEPLVTPDPPYLPEITKEREYCLVLDLDETLVHYFEVGSEGTFLVRPGCDQFLTEMAEIYEVVIFTAAMQDYADWVLNQIDKPKRITYRLYRQHALPHGPVFVKDLSRIGRDLSKTIIVDNVAENFQLQPDNGIFIKSWFDDMNDTALSELAPLLKQIVKKQVPDVRDALRKFRDQMLEQIAKGVTNPQLSLD